MRISDWSSDVCSSDLHAWVIAVIAAVGGKVEGDRQPLLPRRQIAAIEGVRFLGGGKSRILPDGPRPPGIHAGLHPARERSDSGQAGVVGHVLRSEEHTSELQSLMRISYAVFCLKKKKTQSTQAITLAL